MTLFKSHNNCGERRIYYMPFINGQKISLDKIVLPSDRIGPSFN